ncbi:MAG TPA: M14 family zinc carboxypeptidase [Oscillospiraceae bacterium]|nr:M14 family zinc carboxypeptidase [Oscillospiraceae bacterium]HPF55441.1 M14 family zinc carboxypeptidase [Clostridiales bacterium]HPK36245.1 M14 family zinc carboxypeptidase [Oscillospiraceae bacterium]HPR75487.1 M14 family zinc carboxypeptidase [Oscillospiraceae bacterium]
MTSTRLLAPLLACLLFCCACADTTAPSSIAANAHPSSEISSVPLDFFAELGIPETVGFDGIYTRETRQMMLSLGFTYSDVEALIDQGYTTDEIFLFTTEEKDVYAVAGRFTPHESLLELTKTLYSEIENLDDYFTSFGDENTIVPELIQYGESVLGRPLYYYHIKNPNREPTKKVMLTFAIHGYEGEASCDGAYLAEQAYQIAFFYCLKPQYLEDAELFIVPMVNPDGVMNRNGGEKFGRGQSQGIDMNRDFLKGQFKAQETVALRNLMKELSPDVFIDFHGWYDESYGDAELGRAFAANLGLAHVSEEYGTRQGYLYGYAKSQGARALLVEHSGYASVNTKDLILSLNIIMRMDLSQTAQ